MCKHSVFVFYCLFRYCRAPFACNFCCIRRWCDAKICIVVLHLELHCVTARCGGRVCHFLLVSYTLRNRAHVVRIKARWLFLGRLSRPLGFVVCTSCCAYVWSLNVSILYEIRRRAVLIYLIRPSPHVTVLKYFVCGVFPLVCV